MEIHVCHISYDFVWHRARSLLQCGNWDIPNLSDNRESRWYCSKKYYHIVHSPNSHQYYYNWGPIPVMFLWRKQPEYGVRKKLEHLFFEITKTTALENTPWQITHENYKNAKSITTEEVLVGCKILKGQGQFTWYIKDNVPEDIFRFEILRLCRKVRTEWKVWTWIIGSLW